MSYNNDIFPNETKTKTKLKSFIIAFGIFIVILSVCSVVLFMYSLDFDINNLVESTTEIEETTTQEVQPVYSVESLTGGANVMFIVTDSNDKVQSVFCTLVDFDSKTFKVKQIDGDAQYLFGKTYKSMNGIYTDFAESGLADFFSEKWGITVDEFVVFKQSDLRKFLSSYNGFTVNVSKDINFKSGDFNLELTKGKQDLSAEKALNYLMVCENKEEVLCDIITSVLRAEYVDEAESLFKKFANLSKSEISIIDFYDSLETLKTYCYADDKFLPQPF